MQKIVPNLWFQGNAAEGAEFYEQALPNTRLVDSSNYPTEGLLDFQKDLAGELLTAVLDIDGFQVLLINAGEEFTPNPAISFMLNFDPSRDENARATLERVWDRLSQGSTALMPLDTYPFSEYYGWVQDRYGVSWQLMLTNPGGEPRPFVTPSLMFGGQAQNRAKQAVEYYTGVFGDANLGTFVPYADQTGPAVPGTVMYSDFTLEGQWFSAMDSGVAQDFSFTPGVSLMVNCNDQDEIDRLWEALSAVPEAEQCGWCTDQFGVSWQIVPVDTDDLMKRPEAFERMMTMKKIDIAQLRGD
ncbi:MULTISPECIES: VOC family protein [unclassified Candidatus Sulfotelmatobacter]|uniref:VOC family protein n=1 Tax=unclassified Candidatus Sulfotelmatobacter TaxID=2635724 RepID=UPI00168422E6|nr:VOC family protein [Kocuria sp. cx-116]MBD2763099.1 VOC family protein [Kocuria sp. cx-116]